MNEALLLYGLFSLFTLHSFFGPKDPMLQSISSKTKRALVKEEFPAATADITAALATDSLNPTLSYLRGFCRSRMKQWPAANQDFSRAIRLDSTNGWYYIGRARTNFARHRLFQARADYALAFKRTPSCHTDTDVAAQMGVTELFLNNAPQAAAELELATVLDLRNDFALFYLTVARTICHKPQAAAASCKEYIKWHAKRPEGYVNRALLNCSLGNYKQAAADVNLALELAPTDTLSALAKVVITESGGNSVGARAQMATLLLTTTNKSGLYLDLGDFYRQVGKTEAANQHWLVAQQLGNTEAAERLAAKVHSAP